MRGVVAAVAGTVMALAGACQAFRAGAAADPGPGPVEAGAHEDAAPSPELDADKGEPRPDARPPTRPDCRVFTCSGRDAGPCAEESCGTSGAGSWPTLVNQGDGNSTNDTDCYSTASAGSKAYKTVNLPSAPRYAFELHVQITPDATKTSAIAELATGGLVAVRLVAEAGKLRLCDGKSHCSAPLTIGLSNDVNVYGVLGATERYGSAIVDLGRDSCTEIAAIDLDGPFPGDVIARIGCLGDAPCHVMWDDAFLYVRPY